MGLRGLHAVYLPPSLPRSRQAGRSLEEAVIPALAATHLYAGVRARYAAEAARPRDLVERFTPARPGVIDITVL